ncbi:hypothetical protein HYT33_00930 [Candidatus Roizmanbacteria bacterium]|nr:hypothetical protein [Candidatus Roizmanbacteria bacterium]
MRKILAFFILALFVLSVASSIYAARVLPRFSGSSKGRRGYSGIAISARLRGDRKALMVNFGNLRLARSVSYTLVYQTDGKDEGASGAIDASSGVSATRELLFGTCSAGVCRYHSNIQNARLEVVTVFPSGKKSVRRFRIRV